MSGPVSGPTPRPAVPSAPAAPAGPQPAAPGTPAAPATQTPAAPPPAQPHASDRFVSGPAPAAQRESTQNAAVNAAMTRFYDNLARAYGVPPEQARTNPQLLVGRPLTEQGREQLLNATRDLILDLPPNALSPQVAGAVRGLMPGISADQMNRPLRELGPAAGRAALDVARDLWRREPGAVVALGVAGATAAGAVAVSQGTEALNRLGLPRSFEFPIVGQALQGRLGVSFGPGFSNPGGTVGLSTRIPAGPASVTLSGQVTGSVNDGVTDVRGSVGVRTPDLTATVSGGHDFTRGRTQLDASLSVGRPTTPQVGLSGSLVLDHGRPAQGTAALSVTVPRPDVRVSAGVRTDFTTGTTSGQLRASGPIGRNGEWFVTGDVGHDGGRTSGQVMGGVGFRF